MKFTTSEQFLQQPLKHVTLLGMSGVGKTHVSQLLAKAGWFHFSVDYHIGKDYLNPDIEAAILQEVKHIPAIEQGLFQIKSNLSVDDLRPLSHFIGQLGNPEQGGISHPEFVRRQSLHYQAEVASMHDSISVIESAKQQGYDNIINDAGGSLCEIEDSGIFEAMAPHTLLLYIESSPQDIEQLIERAIAYPKPLYFNADFLIQRIEEYLTLNELEYVAQMNPTDFSRWVFPLLVASRKQKMDELCERYGYKITSEAIQSVHSSEDFLTCIAEAIDACQS